MNKAIGFPFSAKQTQYIKAVNLYWSAQQWPITPPRIQPPQGSSFLAGSDMMVHTLYSLLDPCYAVQQEQNEQSWTTFCSQGKLVKRRRCQKYIHSNSQELVNAVPEALPHPPPTTPRQREDASLVKICSTNALSHISRGQCQQQFIGVTELNVLLSIWHLTKRGCSVFWESTHSFHVLTSLFVP